MKNKFTSKKLENLTKELELANQTRKEAIKDLTVSEEELQIMLDKINELNMAISEEVTRIAAKVELEEELEEELETEEGEQMKLTEMIAGEVKYNRSAIMKEGWKLKKDGIKEGISIAWKMAKEEKARIEEEIKAEYERQQNVEAAAELEAENSPEYYWEEDLLMELKNEDERLHQLEEMELEDLYKMAKDLKGKHMDLETMIARAIIKNRRKEVA